MQTVELERTQRLLRVSEDRADNADASITKLKDKVEKTSAEFMGEASASVEVRRELTKATEEVNALEQKVLLAKKEGERGLATIVDLRDDVAELEGTISSFGGVDAIEEYRRRSVQVRCVRVCVRAFVRACVCVCMRVFVQCASACECTTLLNSTDSITPQPHNPICMNPARRRAPKHTTDEARL